VQYAYDAESATDSSGGQWTHCQQVTESCTNDEWHLVDKATVPSAVHGGNKAWFFGNDNGTPYADGADAFLDSPTITRTSPGWAELTFYANIQTEPTFDGLTVLASDNNGLQYREVPLIDVGPPQPPALTSAQITGDSSGYRQLTFDLTGFTGSTLMLRFEFSSDAITGGSGVAIDDLAVLGAVDASVGSFIDGSSAPNPAVPVGGLASLGTLTVTPERDAVRLEHVELTRTGSSTDADVPAADLQLPDGRVVHAPFSSGVARFDGVHLDSKAASPAQMGVVVEVAPGALVGRTVGVDVGGSSASFASPDFAFVGTGHIDSVTIGSAGGSTPPVAQTGGGYRLVASDGGIFSYGNAPFFGSAGGQKLNKPIVGMARTPSGNGYWLVASDGGIFNYGDAGFFGSAGGAPLNKPIVGMAASPTGKGYWLVASDGGIFNYGDAGFFGSAGGAPLNKPVVGMAASPTGKGYWLVASDGGIFNYGDAGFFGSAGGAPLNKPVVAMASTASAKGYWLAASDGGIFNYGDAGFFGSAGGAPLNKPVVGLAATSTGKGYWMVATDGGIFNYGDAGFFGSAGGTKLNQPVVGMSTA
jgi:hypothetical protein